MIHQIALRTLFGFPLVAYLGTLTFLSFLFVAYIGYTNYKNAKHHLPFRWHPAMVIVSFSIALVHMFFGLSVVMGF
ncbi:MAG: hypothetical protein ABI716_01350 [Candidatus Saccharibacteria bacterium]